MQHRPLYKGIRMPDPHWNILQRLAQLKGYSSRNELVREILAGYCAENFDTLTKDAKIPRSA
jgi:metal-responsive CopG/Arc/MetJ family transcriptional regulator